MAYGETFKVGDRIALDNLGYYSFGTIKTVHPNDGGFDIEWDDGFDDYGDGWDYKPYSSDEITHVEKCKGDCLMADRDSTIAYTLADIPEKVNEALRSLMQEDYRDVLLRLDLIREHCASVEKMVWRRLNHGEYVHKETDLLREAYNRLMVSEGDARYENANIELATRIGEFIGEEQ